MKKKIMLIVSVILAVAMVASIALSGCSSSSAESNDSYVVRTATGEILIPAIEDVVKSIDLDKGCMVIEPVEGLLTLNKKATN